MKTSTLLVASGAILAAASPIAVDKRRIQTEVVVVVQTVTVTDWIPRQSTVYVAPTTTSTTYVAPIIPSTSSTPSTPPAKVLQPQPQTSTSIAVQAPAPVASVVQQPASSPSVEQSSNENSVSTASNALTASTGSTGSTGSIGNDYASVVVNKHNIHRQNNSAQPVTFDADRASYAATLAATCNFHHDTTIGSADYGQNIGAYAGTRAESITAEKALANAIDDMWYSEVSLYPASNYGKPNPDMSNFEAWGHYSAMVWADTKSVGCATQFCGAGTMWDDMGAWFTVCNYYPPGNVAGQYGDNVLPPLGNPSSTTPL